jgi:HEAT repeat protein
MNDLKEFSTLIDRLNDGDLNDPDAEWKAAIALSDVQSPEFKQIAVSALMQKLRRGRSHALIRAHAIESLGKLGDKQAIPLIVSFLKDPYRLVRAYSVAALAKFGDAKTIEPLLDVLEKDDFFGARAEAAKSLGLLSTLMGEDLRAKIVEILKKKRDAESVRFNPGVERVLAEIDHAIINLERREKIFKK